MFEVLVIALLMWLWNIERRLNSIRDSVQILKLDIDGLRAIRSSSSNQPATPPSTPAGLPEVTSLHGGNVKTAKN